MRKIKLIGSKHVFIILFLLVTQISFCQKPNIKDYKEGLKSSIDGDFQKGNISFTNAIKEYPNHIQIDLSLNVSTKVLRGEIPELYATQYFKGNYYLLKGKYKKAKEFYIDAINEDNTLLEAHYNLGFSFLMNNWYSIWQGGDDSKSEETIEIFNNIIAINEDFYPAQEKIAFLYFLTKNYMSALNHLEAALKIKPENEYLYNYLLLCHHINTNQNMVDSLIKTYSNSIDEIIIALGNKPIERLRIGMSFSELQKIYPEHFLYSASTLNSLSPNGSIETRYGEFIFKNGHLKSWTFDENKSFNDKVNSIADGFNIPFLNGLFYEATFEIDKSVDPGSYVPPISF